MLVVTCKGWTNVSEHTNDTTRGSASSIPCFQGLFVVPTAKVIRSCVKDNSATAGMNLDMKTRVKKGNIPDNTQRPVKGEEAVSEFKRSSAILVSFDVP